MRGHLEFLLSWQFLVVLAGICGLNSFVLICLPETVGKPIVESIKEINELNNSENKNENKIEGTKDEEKAEEIKETKDEEKAEEIKEKKDEEKI